MLPEPNILDFLVNAIFLSKDGNLQSAVNA